MRKSNVRLVATTLSAVVVPSGASVAVVLGVTVTFDLNQLALSNSSLYKTKLVLAGSTNILGQPPNGG